MKSRLLDLVVCPKCHNTLSWAWSEAGSGAKADGDGVEVIEAALQCRSCGAMYPVIAGVPRLVRPSLLARMSKLYPDFFARHPEFLLQRADPPENAALVDTFESFTRQRLDLRPPGPEFVSQWRSHLRRNLGDSLEVANLRDQLILDVGCGFGRHMVVASEAGAEIVGVDLSGGVDVAWHNNRRHPRCHVVQADIFDQPFRTGCFDIVWSFGVLHHMPDPHGGFNAIVPFARQDGGRVYVWVYGYRGMALSYRLSHMRPLHRLTRRLGGSGRVRVSKLVAALLSVLYWEPLRAASRLGLSRPIRHLPLTDHLEQGWLARIAAVHDRLSTPITHFHDRPEVTEWFRLGGLTDVDVEDTNRRGWRAHGTRRIPKSNAAYVSACTAPVLASDSRC